MAACCICFVSLTPNCPISAVECGHVFHKKCLDTWLKTCKSQRTCPVCRKQVQLSLIRRLHINFNEDSTYNCSLIQDVHQSLIDATNKLEEMERKVISTEKKCKALLTSKDIYHQRATNLKQQVIDLEKIVTNLKNQLAKETRSCNFYQHEVLALTAQLQEIKDAW